MYAIRSKKINQWFHGINTQVGAGSSLRIQMDDMLPALFRTKEVARVELPLNHLSTQPYGILEVNLQILEHVSWREIRNKRIFFFFRLW